jgi:hypothetical protein
MTNNMPTSAIEEFTLFRKLPLEMRRKVWNAALEEERFREGRIVEVRWSKNGKRFISDNYIPVLLHTCHDSRIEARKALNLLTLAVEVSDSDEHAVILRRLGIVMPDEHKPPSVTLFRTYLDLSLDTIYLAHRHFENGDPRSQQPAKLNEFLKALNGQRLVAQKIRYLAFSGELFKAEEAGASMFNMKALRTVKFVFEDRCCFKSRCAREPHSKLVKFEEMSFPTAPSTQHPQAPQLFSMHMQQNNIGQFNPGIVGGPMQQVPGFAHFNTGLAPLFGLSEEDKRLLKIQAVWHQKDDDLATYLEDMVADRMSESQGQAREDWSDLETFAVTAERDEPAASAIPEEETSSGSNTPATSSLHEGYEVMVNGRTIH